MLKFYDVDQTDPDGEWGPMRVGKLTSSNLSKVMANYGKAFGEPAKKLAVEIALGQITGQPPLNSYSNAHMERGHEQEPIARMLYESHTFCEVTNGGFWCDEKFGCSPDGMVSEGVIEIKSVLAHIHLANIQRGGIDPAYKWQCIANLHYTGSKWLDFVSYCADFPPDKQLYICRITPDVIKGAVEKIKIRVSEFNKMVDEYKSAIIDGDYFTSISEAK